MTQPPATTQPTRAGTRASVGKVLLTLVLLFPAVGGFGADWNETHIFNPDWPPHARFHNAQTLMFAVLLGLLGLWFLWAPRYGLPRLRLAALFGALYWVAQAPAILFPGAGFVDPPDVVPTVAGVPANQLVLQLVVVYPLLAVGYVLEARRLRRSGSRSDVT